MPRRVPPSPAPSSPAATATMRANRRRDSRPELALRRALHACGLRFRVDFPVALATGKTVRPDVVFTKARVAVFVDGCYWHGCPVHHQPSKSNVEYWEAKIARNRQRDLEQDAGLRRAGWSVVRVWEHTPTTEAAQLVMQQLLRRGYKQP